MPEIIKISKNNLITYFYDGVKKYEYTKNYDGKEEWIEYNKQGKIIYFKSSNGFKEWTKYDKQGKLIYLKNSDGFKWWYEEQKEIVNEKDVKPFEFSS